VNADENSAVVAGAKTNLSSWTLSSSSSSIVRLFFERIILLGSVCYTVHLQIHTIVKVGVGVCGNEKKTKDTVRYCVWYRSRNVLVDVYFVIFAASPQNPKKARKPLCGTRAVVSSIIRFYICVVCKLDVFICTYIRRLSVCMNVGGGQGQANETRTSFESVKVFADDFDTNVIG